MNDQDLIKPGSIRVALYEHRWLRMEQAAEYIGVTPTFMKTLIRKGEVAYAVAGRRYLIDRRDLDAFLERRRQIRPQIRPSAAVHNEPKAETESR